MRSTELASFLSLVMLITPQVLASDLSEAGIKNREANELYDAYVDASSKLQERHAKEMDEATSDLKAKLKSVAIKLLESTNSEDEAEGTRILEFRKTLQLPKQDLREIQELKATILTLQRRRGGATKFSPRTLVGTWEFYWDNPEGMKKRTRNVQFGADGSVDGAKGVWKLDSERQRILIKWKGSSNAWESLHLPFVRNQTTGDSHAGPGIISAKKID